MAGKRVRIIKRLQMALGGLALTGLGPLVTGGHGTTVPGRKQRRSDRGSSDTAHRQQLACGRTREVFDYEEIIKRTERRQMRPAENSLVI